MPQIVRIVAAVLDTRQLTLYKETGEAITIPQGDLRINRLVQESLACQSQGFADVDLAKPDEPNYFAEFEKQSEGRVQLLKISKNHLKSVYVDTSEGTPVTVIVGDVSQSKMKDAIADIMKHAVPVTDADYHEEDVKKQGNIVEEDGSTNKQKVEEDNSTHTIIGIVDGKVIPGMERIKSQFERAAKMGSTKGVERFLARLGSVIEQRKHSVDDLLKFMERADMPIAEDGTIVIYKVLKRTGDRTEGKYVDCHTRKVEQWTGAFVCMDEKLVDHNRNNECSNGLHVARRGYISQFSGDVCVLAKLAPEDVIAVPTYDANKMRVCGYHILAELTEAQYALLNRNRPITEDPEGKILLANVLAGKHIHHTHEVRITGHKGEGVMVTRIDKPIVIDEPFNKEVQPVEALKNPEPKKIADPVIPKEVHKQVAQVSRKEQAKQLFEAYKNAEEGAEDALRAFKKAAKVSWDNLGIPDPATVKPRKPSTLKGAKKITTPSLTKEKVEDAYVGSPRERIKKLISIGLTKDIAQKVLDIKRKAKKSWGDLGVSPTNEKKILKLVG